MRATSSIVAAMVVMQMVVDVLADAWPTIVAAGLIGGLAFALVGALTMRA